MTAFINLCPHDVKLNSGTVYPATGTIARVKSSFTDFDASGVAEQVFGEVTGIPESQANTLYIVSGMVLDACKRTGIRTDVVAPATGHPGCQRDDKGQIKSVPGFVR